MTRLLTLIPTVLLATTLVAAQAPAGDQPSAQQPTVQQPSSPPPSSQSAPSASPASKVTYTGCLKPGSTPDSWVLDSAVLSPPAGASASSSSADRAVGTSGTASAKQAFNLIAKSSDNLTPHTNHQIEVTGITSPAVASSMGSSSASGASSSPSASAAPKQNLSIDSFKMISATCP